MLPGQTSLFSGLKYQHGAVNTLQATLKRGGFTEIVQKDEKTVSSEMEAAIIHELNILPM